MYDVTFEIVTEVVHLIFEVLHNLFEVVELGIEHGVEHLLHTDRHGSQIITFYTLMLMIGFLLYKLKFVVSLLYVSCRQFARDSWIRRKTQLTQFWQKQNLLNRSLIGLGFLVFLYLASFFVM
jgi:hypothetical protein